MNDSGSAAAQTTTDSFADLAGSVWDCRRVKTKTIVIANTGGSNGASVTILGSVDSGPASGVVNWDSTVLASTNIAANAVSVQKITDYYTAIKIQIKAQVGGSQTPVAARWAGIDA